MADDVGEPEHVPDFVSEQLDRQHRIGLEVGCILRVQNHGRRRHEPFWMRFETRICPGYGVDVVVRLVGEFRQIVCIDAHIRVVGNLEQTRPFTACGQLQVLGVCRKARLFDVRSGQIGQGKRNGSRSRRGRARRLQLAAPGDVRYDALVRIAVFVLPHERSKARRSPYAAETACILQDAMQNHRFETRTCKRKTVGMRMRAAIGFVRSLEFLISIFVQRVMEADAVAGIYGNSREQARDEEQSFRELHDVILTIRIQRNRAEKE